MKRLLLAAAAGLAATVTFAAPPAVQFQKPEDAIKFRVGAFNIMQTELGHIGAMVKGTIPFDGPTAAANADVLAMIAQLPFQGFVEGTAGADGKGAKPNIWTEHAKFEEAAKKMQAATANLATAARSNNLDAVKAAYGSTTSSCKACHDNFRAR